jgi:hypothetical protein
MNRSCGIRTAPAAFLLAALALVAALAPAWAESPAAIPGAGGLRLVGGPWLPYRFATAKLEAQEGITGTVSVTGTYWDDSSRLLFSARSRAWSASFDLAFYVDEDLKSLDIRAETAAGPRELSVDLSAAALAEAAPGAEEVARRAAMRALPFPYLNPHVGRPPAKVAFTSVDLRAAAIQATEACLVREPPIASLAALAVLALLAGLLGSLWPAPARRGSAKERLAGTGLPPPRLLGPARLAVALLALAATLALLPATPLLTRVELPRPDATGGYRAVLEARRGMAASVRVTDFAPSGDPGPGGSHLALIAAATPGPRGIALDLVVPAGRDCVFSSRPLVTLREGNPELRFAEPSLGWTSWR